MKIEIHNINRNDLAQKFFDWGFKIGVEIGTQSGNYAEILCRTNKDLVLYTLDLFDLVYEDDYTSRIGRRRQTGLYEKAVGKLTPYKCIVLKMSSIEALKLFDYGQLDFVYIDGAHQYDYVTTDIAMWGQKVKKDGIISGHDYDESIFPGVVKAVSNYAEIHGVKTINITTDHTPSWWFKKTW